MAIIWNGCITVRNPLVVELCARQEWVRDSAALS
jgi:hypothetical protein